MQSDSVYNKIKNTKVSTSLQYNRPQDIEVTARAISFIGSVVNWYSEGGLKHKKYYRFR